MHHNVYIQPLTYMHGDKMENTWLTGEEFEKVRETRGYIARKIRGGFKEGVSGVVYTDIQYLLNDGTVVWQYTERGNMIVGVIKWHGRAILTPEEIAQFPVKSPEVK